MNGSSDKGYTIYCSRCGAEMNSNSRYCMKCGNLNYDHSANASMKNYVKSDNSSYQVGSGKLLVGNDSNQTMTIFANNTGNKNKSFYGTLIFYILSLIVSFFITNDLSSFNIMNILNSLFPYCIIILSIIFFYLYFFQQIFVKCNKPWWASFVPVYNFMILSEIVFHKKWIGLLCFIPIIGFFVGLVLLYQLGKKFKLSGFLVVILPFLYLPIIGYGDRSFDGVQFANEKDALEIDYKRKKIILLLTIFFFILGIICVFIYNQSSVENGWSNFKKYYYVYCANKITSKVKNQFDKGNYSCDSDSSNSSEYYFYFSNIEDYVYVPFSYLREGLSGYVKVVIDDGGEDIYISVSDGKYGFPLTNINDIDTEKVKEYSTNYSISDFSNYCHLK